MRLIVQNAMDEAGPASETPCRQGENYGVCVVHPPCEMVSSLIREQGDRIHEQNVQYNDAMFPVYQVCEACGPAVLDEAGKCPTCKQVYDFKRWLDLTNENQRLRELIAGIYAQYDLQSSRPGSVGAYWKEKIDAALSSSAVSSEKPAGT